MTPGVPLFILCKCVQAYEEQMEAKKKQLGDKLPELLSIIEEDAKVPKVDVDELKCMEVLGVFALAGKIMIFPMKIILNANTPIVYQHI